MRRTWVWMPRIHKILGMVAHVCDPRASTEIGEGWGAGEFQEAHGLARLASTVPKNRRHLKQSRRQVPTPKVVVWVPHICHGMRTPLLSNTNIHATHTEKVRKKNKTKSSACESEGQRWEEVHHLDLHFIVEAHAKLARTYSYIMCPWRNGDKERPQHASACHVLKLTKEMLLTRFKLKTKRLRNVYFEWFPTS